MDVRQNFLHELNEDRILIDKWIPGPTNDADLHTKNIAASEFEKHDTVYTGKNRYSSMT